MSPTLGIPAFGEEEVSALKLLVEFIRPTENHTHSTSFVAGSLAVTLAPAKAKTASARLEIAR
ncbi:MAG: hypothetical protein K8R23_12260 [Chthoniobacter sp.]|nr:hypothetical protein [Chthoniobacter sp.]